MRWSTPAATSTPGSPSSRALAPSVRRRSRSFMQYALRQFKGRPDVVDPELRKPRVQFAPCAKRLHLGHRLRPTGELCRFVYAAALDVEEDQHQAVSRRQAVEQV